MKKLTMIIFISLLCFTFVHAESFNNKLFHDVPTDHWSYEVTHRLKDLGVTNGIGNNRFGLGQPIKRGQFVTFLARLMEWETVHPTERSFNDIKQDQYYYEPIETALKNRVILNDSESFRPDDNITREEMAIMIVRTLGYEHLAKQLNYSPPPFDDISNNIGYITIARDLGIINGRGNNKFDPKGYANREHAAAMMVRMYDLLNNHITEIHGFYAIQSYSQKQLIPNFDSVSFGWSRLEYDERTNTVILNNTRENNNVFAKPMGASELLDFADKHGVSKQLMVFAENSSFSDIKNLGLIEYILSNQDIRTSVIELLINEISNDNTYDGLVIDFELMRGKDLAQLYNVFLFELKEKLNSYDKQLYVAVHPARKPGESYFDGYDFKTIGEIADRVILMAHDYSVTRLSEQEMLNKYTLTPLTPIDEIYYALRAITDEKNGVQDTSKISLQISFDSVQWKIKDDRIINPTPFRPTYDAIYRRMLKEDIAFNYSKTFENPFITFHNDEDETYNVLWYEDSRSINAKIDLAKLFGVNGISLWRLGNIPNFDNDQFYLNVWEEILNSK